MRGEWLGGGDGGRSGRSTLLALLVGAGFLAFVAGRVGVDLHIRNIVLAGALVVVAGVLSRGGRRGREERHEAPPEVPEEVLDELEDLRGRLLELEERADFSERLLAQQRERQALERTDP